MAIVVLSYYTHRLYVFAHKSSDYFAYLSAGLDCMIQENGQNESDVDVLFKGFKSRQEYADAANKEFPDLYPKDGAFLNRTEYNDQIPECKVFYSQYRCWELDPHDPKSLDGCGKHFGLTQDEIDTMKKDPSKIDQIMDAMFERMKKGKRTK